MQKNPKEIGRLGARYVDSAESQADHSFRLEDLVSEQTRQATVDALFAACGLEPTPEVQELAARLPRVNGGKTSGWDERLERTLLRVAPTRTTLTALGYRT